MSLGPELKKKKGNTGKHKDFNVRLDFSLNMTLNFESLDMLLVSQKEIFFLFLERNT